MRMMIDMTDGTAHLPGDLAWQGAVTPRIAGFVRIRAGVRVSAHALWRETAPPD
ncbi:MAG: hypothetical protein MJB57_14450 [Gemmatimonadetes bacterium]|nr:hypothetical protein [Gemmatimonadota bacterium]